MPGWTLVNTHPTQGRTFQRPLDIVELWFFWNGLFYGGTDGLHYCEICLPNGPQDAHLFSKANITKAWLSTKRRFPLAGATVQGADGNPLLLDSTTGLKAGNGAGFTSEPHFVVREYDFTALRPREIIFGTINCAEEMQQYMVTIMDGPRLLSQELLMQLYVFREISPNRTDTLHFMILVAHCVTDRLAINTFVRCFLDTLARGREPTQIPLEERLAMATPSTDHEPQHLRSLSPAIRRWRRAAGTVILQLKMEKRQGGYTLPCRLTPSTPCIAARSALVSTSLTHSQTTCVIANCRTQGITFGNAFIALTQVAMTRVLYRRYLCGEISEEEWGYRKRQPYIGGGPANLRRHLDKSWFKKGGGGESMLSIGLFFYQLPFMTLGETVQQHQRVLSDGAPPFSDLLTFDRFLHRTELVKKQVAAFFNHPLFFEIVCAAALMQTEHTRLGALEWMKNVETANGQDAHGNPDKALAVTDIPTVWAFGGSSAGNLELMFPMEYPVPSAHPLSPYSSVPHPVRAGYITPPSPSTSPSEAEETPRVVVQNSAIHIRARPGELYLTADSSCGQLNMQIFYDRNVFEERDVTEWLDEVRGAILWYLGCAHQPHQARRLRDGGDGHIRVGESVQAKL